MNEKLKEKFDYILKNAIEKKELSGANILVMKGGNELCYLESGYMDIENKKKVQRDTIFRLYSMTKPITAAAAMILMERGELCLQTPVEEYLPSFRDMQVVQNGKSEHAMRSIQIQDLLRMTSGMTYGDDTSETTRRTSALLNEAEQSLFTNTPLTTQQFAEKAGNIPLSFQPGTSWSYGISADIMGAVIEKAAGKSFGEFLEHEIFEPLGMRDTGFYVPNEKQERLAKVYETGTDKGLQEFHTSHLGIRNSMDKKARFESGGAGLVSTIDDYQKFGAMLLQNGSYRGKQILQPRTAQYLTRGHLTGEQQGSFDQWFGQNGFSYGNFMRVLWNPEQALTLGSPMEYCWDGWLGCNFVNCPEEELTFLVMQQKKDAGLLVARLRNVLFANL